MGFQYLAGAVVSIVKNESLLPATIGVFGDWGGGKSTLIEIVRTLELLIVGAIDFTHATRVNLQQGFGSDRESAQSWGEESPVCAHLRLPGSARCGATAPNWTGPAIDHITAAEGLCAQSLYMLAQIL